MKYLSILGYVFLLFIMGYLSIALTFHLHKLRRERRKHKTPLSYFENKTKIRKIGREVDQKLQRLYESNIPGISGKDILVCLEAAEKFNDSVDALEKRKSKEKKGGNTTI